MSYHPNIDQTILDEVSRPTLDLASLDIGQIIRLELAEGLDLDKELSLELSLENLPPKDECHEFRITGGDIPESIVEANRRHHLPIPEMIGGLILVKGGCTYRKSYIPPVTMAHPGHIDKDRHLWTSMETNHETRANSVWYFPFVHNFVVLV